MGSTHSRLRSIDTNGETDRTHGAPLNLSRSSPAQSPLGIQMLKKIFIKDVNPSNFHISLKASEKRNSIILGIHYA
jgi:hypothetical protein